jgi:hypothetical protein
MARPGATCHPDGHEAHAAPDRRSGSRRATEQRPVRATGATDGCRSPSRSSSATPACAVTARATSVRQTRRPARPAFTWRSSGTLTATTRPPMGQRSRHRQVRVGGVAPGYRYGAGTLVRRVRVRRGTGRPGRVGQGPQGAHHLRRPILRDAVRSGDPGVEVAGRPRTMALPRFRSTAAHATIRDDWPTMTRAEARPDRGSLAAIVLHPAHGRRASIPTAWNSSGANRTTCQS